MSNFFKVYPHSGGDYIVPPGGTWTIDTNGEYVRCLRASGEFLLGLDGTAPSYFAPGLAANLPQGREFRRVDIVNTSAEPLAVQIVVGFGDFQDTRLTTTAELSIGNFPAFPTVYPDGLNDVARRGRSRLGSSHFFIAAPSVTSAATYWILMPSANVNGLVVRTVNAFIGAASGDAQLQLGVGDAPVGYNMPWGRYVALLTPYQNNLYEPVEVPAGFGLYLSGSSGAGFSFFLTWDLL